MPSPRSGVSMCFGDIHAYGLPPESMPPINASWTSAELDMTTWLLTLRFSLVTCVVPLAAIVSTGCGAADTGRVSGTVLNASGAPLVRARVIARSAETGKSVYATSDSSGNFELNGGDGEGLPAGEYDVIVLEDRGDPDVRQPLTVAAKYRNHETSGLKVTVKAGESIEMNLELNGR